ncbi:PAS domain-containing sensor histidine kinase [Lewinella cohaerens]|uniref:PAS domain-containing sensor histidine kinase n=1 Tax=Lewinella cohaerens TaxID=70995 RepID=UPI000364690C|nr:ATP-binding protein [Lewinella cohaerens]
MQETYRDILLKDTNRLVIELTNSRAFRKKLPEVLKTISAHLKTEQSYLLEVRPVKGMLNQLVYKKIIEVSATGEKTEHTLNPLFSEIIFSQRVLKSWLTDLANLSKTHLSIGQSSENSNLPNLIFVDQQEEVALNKVNNNQICRKIFDSLGISFSSFLLVPLVYEQAILGFFATHSSNLISHAEPQLEMIVTLMQLTANLYACEYVEDQRVLHENYLLKTSEKRYRKFIRHSVEGIYFMNCGKPISINAEIDAQVESYYANAYVEECNLAMAEMYGFEKESDLISKRIEALHQGENYEQNKLTFKRLAENNYQIKGEHTKELDKYGNWKYFINEAFGIVEDNHLLGIWGIQRDITEKYQNERGDALLEAVLHAIPDIKIRINVEGEILALYGSEQKQDKNGLTFQDSIITGKHLTEVLPVFVAKGLLFNARKSLEEKTLQAFEFLDADSSDGNVRYYEARINNINTEELIIILRNVTQLKIAEQALTEQISQVDQKNRQLQKYIESNLQLENFAFVASHDLREPVRTMRTFGQFLKKRVGHKLDEESMIHLDFIINSASRMNQLIEDLLTYSRVNTESVTRDPIELGPLLEEITDSLKATIEETGAKIIFKSLPSVILGNRLKIQQVFQNLLANGIKFHRKNESPKIIVSVKETKTHWRFMVADNGIGIEEEFHEQIFVIFKKLHNYQEYQGTGIGLTLVKSIVNQHGGEIWLESKVGKGTTFYFTLLK